MEDHSSYGSALVDAAMNGAEEFVNYPERATTRVWHGFVPDHYARHWHGDVEIIMTLKGCVRVTVGEDPFRVKEGEVLIIPAGQSHSLTMGQDSERYLYQFQLSPVIGIHDFALLRRLLITPLYLTRELPVTGPVRALLTEVAEEAWYRDGLSDLNIYSCFLRMYALLGRAWKSGQLSGLSSPKRTANQVVIDDAVNYITRHYMEPVSLDFLARSASFSRCYFSRIFRRYTGMTFTQFLTRKRLSVAGQLLVYSDLPVSQVCIQSGFASLATFTRVFREQLGMSPSAYRRACRERDRDAQNAMLPPLPGIQSPTGSGGKRTGDARPSLAPGEPEPKEGDVPDGAPGEAEETGDGDIGTI